MKSKWTFLIYMAGDNNLRTGAEKDIAEMKKSNPDKVRVGVQLDRSETNTIRFQVNDTTERPENLGENLNAGRPSVLADFLKWGQQELKAPNIAVVAWNHGMGWLDFTFDVLRKNLPSQADAKQLLAGRSAMFKKSIIYSQSLDQTSRDFIDNKEFGKALRAALGPKKKFSLLCCDACFMSMVEVMHEVRDCATIFVGSEELEASDGWPYDDILTRMSNEVSVETAAKAIVAAYRKATAHDPLATLSAVRLNRIDAVAEGLDGLGAELMSVVKTDFTAIATARARAYDFLHNDYLDLRDLADQFRTRLSHVGKVVAAAERVMKAVDKAVIDTSNDTTETKAFGLSIYLPNTPVDAKYAALSLSKAAPRWAKFVTYYGKNRSPQ